MFCKFCNKEKQPTDFYKGKPARCKPCQMDWQTKYRQSPIYKEKARIYFVKWRKENPDKYRSTTLARQFKWQQEHPKEFKCQQAVYRAVKTGKLIRPSVCSICKLNRRVCAHHRDYTKPLEVLWLCWSCHKFEHRPPHLT